MELLSHEAQFYEAMLELIAQLKFFNRLNILASCNSTLITKSKSIAIACDSNGMKKYFYSPLESTYSKLYILISRA